MMYYPLIRNSDPKVIGVHNGIMQVMIESDLYFDEQEYNRLIAGFSDYENNIENTFFSHAHFEILANLLPKAKLTDFLLYGPKLNGCPFIISDKVSELLKGFKIQNYKTYPVSLYKDGNLFNNSYRLFHCPVQSHEIIDFKKSTFFTGSSLLKNRRQLSFNNFEEYVKHSIPLPLPETLVLRKF
jgi:hypothetical protein